MTLPIQITDPPVSMHFVIFASYGNDSITLIQNAHECRWKNVDVVYSDTGWAARWWPERVARMQPWVKALGFRPVVLPSEGMKALVARKKGWPRQGMQFCTEELKVKPAQAWLGSADPESRAICVVGVRREESRSRQDFPLWRSDSPVHGGRVCFAPLAKTCAADRDAIIRRAGFEPLPHRSKECFPCVNSNKADLLALAEDEARVDDIAAFEESLGVTGKGKPRTLFRPASHMGATGLREIIRWAKSERGQFSLDDGSGGGNCDGGYCGT